MKEYAYQTTAMGSEVSVSFVCTQESDALKAQQYALTTIRQYEACFSRFIPKSELSVLNTQKNLCVSDIFYEVFVQAMTLAEQTDYCFNPLLQIHQLGYTHTFTELSKQTNHINTVPYDIDTSTIEANPITRQITLKDHQQLDFGGILKGFLSEKITKQIQSDHPDFQGIIINLGGDLHTKGVDEDGATFVFSIYNPITKQEHEFPLHNQSLATSGTYKRTWQTNAKTHHHILDKTGTANAKTSILSASVIGTNGALCEAYTKVLINKQLDQAIPLLTKQNLHFFVVDTQGNITTNL